MAAHTVIRAMATERRRAERGRSVNERAAAGGPIMRREDQQGTDHGDGHGGGRGEDEEEGDLHAL